MTFSFAGVAVVAATGGSGWGGYNYRLSVQILVHLSVVSKLVVNNYPCILIISFGPNLDKTSHKIT